MENIRKTTNHSVKYFKFSAAEANIKHKNRFDLGLIKSDIPCNAAAVFTTNNVKAAPVKLCMKNIINNIDALIVNSGNANACTGDSGYSTAVNINSELAKLINSNSSNILQCSTGVIGHKLPEEKIISTLPKLHENLKYDNTEIFSKSIMTTDTFPKSVSYEFETSNGVKKITVFAKGSGMIAPNMATLLCFTVTDFSICKKDLGNIFRNIINKTLNAITVDGDTSTNDTAIILSPQLNEQNTSQDIEIFEKALNKSLEDISMLLVKDGEGATKCVKITVNGAISPENANKCAKTVAESLLVKTALFGEDPNWGRIACAAGYSGVEFDPEIIDILFNDVYMLKNGIPKHENLKKAEIIIKNEYFEIIINLKNGNHSSFYLTSDISYDYVKINAEYTT